MKIMIFHSKFGPGALYAIKGKTQAKILGFRSCTGCQISELKQKIENLFSHPLNNTMKVIRADFEGLGPRRVRVKNI